MKMFVHTVLLPHIVFVLLVGAAVLALPSVTAADTGAAASLLSVMEPGRALTISSGPVLADRMLHSWVALGAAIVLLLLTLFMRGGALRWPFLLIGAGLLIDAIFGLALTVDEYGRVLWLSSLFKDAGVVLAALWIGMLFGMFRRQKSSQAPGSENA